MVDLQITENDNSSFPSNIVESLVHHPFSYILPKQDLVSFAGPFHIKFSSDELSLSQETFVPADSSNDDVLMDQILKELDTPAEDLKYVKFKKPAMKLAVSAKEGVKPILQSTSFPTIEKQVLEKTEPVTNIQWTRPSLKVKRIKLNDTPDDLKADRFFKSARKRGPLTDGDSTFDQTTDLKSSLETSHNQELNRDVPVTSGDFVKLATTNITNLVDNIGQEDTFNFSDSSLWLSYFSSDASYNLPFDHILNIETIQLLEDNINRLSVAKAFENFEIDTLLRLQVITSRSVIYALSISWSKLSDSTDIQEKNCLIHLACNVLKASNILLRLLSSGRPEKQLYLESYPKLVLDFIFMLTDEVLLMKNHEIASDCELRHFDILLQQISFLFDTISSYVEASPLDEHVIIRLEYFSFNIMFHDQEEKPLSAFLDPLYDMLKASASNIIYSIFYKHVDQREFILTEIANSMTKLPLHKVAARKFRLTSGINVQLVSSLFVRLIQTSHISDYVFDSSYWKLVSDHRSAAKSRNFEELNSQFYDHVTSITNETASMSNQISGLLITRLAGNPDSLNKKSFELLLEDLLAMLSYPEYSGAETLLESLMSTLLYVCNSDKYSNTLDFFAMEMVRVISSKILSLRSTTKNSVRFSTKMSEQNFSDITDDYLAVLYYLKEDTDSCQNNSYNFLLTKLFVAIRSLSKSIDDIPEATRCSESCYQGLSSLSSKIEALEIRLIRSLNSEDSIESRGSCSYSKVLEVYRNVLLSQRISSYYESFQNLIVKKLDDSKAKSRKGAVKHLQLIIGSDPSLLNAGSIKSSIVSALNESFSSVRDSMLDLIGAFIDSHPEIIKEYYVIVCDKIGDPSISVRRKSMNLAIRMYTNIENRGVKALISERLLRRLDDEEESIVDLATKSLLNMWFYSMIKDWDSQLQKGNKKVIMTRVDNIVDVINANDRNWAYFERFIKEKVLFVHSLNEATHSLLISAVSLMIDSILEFVTELVDECNDQTHIESLMGILSIFLKIDGSFISQDQLVSLQPYLLDESSAGNSLCFYTLQIFRFTLPRMHSLKPAFVTQCLSILLSRITKFNARDLDEAMPCLWLLANESNETIKLAKACIASLHMIRPYITKIKAPEYKPDSKIQRLLFLLGNFGRYCKFSEHQGLFLTSKLGMKQNESVTSLIFKHLLIFCSETLNSDLKRVAVRNLINVCITNARFFMSEQLLSVIDQAYEASDMSLQDVVTKGLGTFLELEEKKVIELNGLESKDSKRVKLDVAVFHGESANYVNDGICSALVQRYLEPIMKNCLVDELDHSFKSIRFLQLVVKMGFANPKLCFPTIIALESSAIFSVRSAATLMHEELFEKHESLIESSYIEGLKLAVEYRKRLSPDLFQEKYFLITCMKIIQTNRNSARKFLKIVTKSFNMIDLSKPSQDLEVVSAFIGFISVNLSVVTLKTQEEVLMIIDATERTLDTVGIDFSEQRRNIDSEDGWYKLGLISKCLESLMLLRSVLLSNYNVSSEKIEKYRLTPNSKDFYASINKVDSQEVKLDKTDMNLKSKGRAFAKSVCKSFNPLNFLPSDPIH
ncbi:hypothetical protein CANARDRAFT_21388 [[Candida] arabinofermentans NRRL YB-2248]|uniref:Sister chromatid cohesion protein n=1 Tax=[Candida] arabinofermentans NRRL YB-2248 TaxID=983967 RepID=A0A1E4T6P3_9ASCO|nr:hypothetical protein CANARDRAFT_21388 [[Candida] arabinofermentans NRRL YB-2248]